MNALQTKKTSRCAAVIRDWLLPALPLILMDVGVRVQASHVTAFPVYSLVANLFTLAWIVLIVGVSRSLPGRWGRVFYGACTAIFGLLYIVHGVYYSMTSFYFSFDLLEMAQEGSGYVLDALRGAGVWLWVSAAGILVLAVLGARCLPRLGSKRRLLRSLVCFAALYALSFAALGPRDTTLQWDAFQNARHIYEDFSDVNKAMRVTGLYEFTLRSLWKELAPDRPEENELEEAELAQIYADAPQHADNAYTGLFAGKNVIFLQMEGMDTWLLNQTDTPNLYALQTQSIQFANHYSSYTGGGSTFNCEFAVNTGFLTPFSYVRNAYSFHKNTFDQSLPNVFHRAGYRVDAFHMNSGEFYSRDLNYRSWGYDHYYGLMDLGDTEQCQLDRELILNETFYRAMFQNSEPFVDYIITYTPHTPFSTEAGTGKLLAHMRYGEDVPALSEEACARMMAGETDYMVGLLLQALRAEGLYDNTVIVAFADHYLYTLQDKSILDAYKTTSNNLINHTPFFIWSSDLAPVTVQEVTMHANILPTVLNLFGLSYAPGDYLGQDALAEDYAGLAVFPDGAWYNGRLYMADGQVTGMVKPSDSETAQKLSQQAGLLMRKNDLTLKYDYFQTRNAEDSS